MTNRLLKIIAWPAFENAARNPYQSQLYDAVDGTQQAKIVEFSAPKPFSPGRYDIVHLHWPDAFLAAGGKWQFWLRYIYLRALAFVVRLRGARLVWTVHNLNRSGQRHSHLIARYFWPWFLKRLDGVVFLTQASKKQTLLDHPHLSTTPAVVIPHGHYRQIVEAASQGEPDPATDVPEALFFGSITAYKNVWQLLEGFLQVPKGQALLSIRGKVSRREPDLRLQALLDDLPQERADEIAFEDAFLSEPDLVSCIQNADLVVLPYSDVFNSGAVLFALSVGRPVLVSDVALFRELRDQIGAQWVRLIDQTLDGAQLMRELKAARVLRQDGARPDLSILDWDHIADQTVAFYEELTRT